MLDLVGLGEVFFILSLLFWAVAIAALVLVLIVPKSVVHKVIGAVAVIALFAYYPVTGYLERKKIADARKTAWAHFEMRCKSAGEQLHKTVDDVEGVLLMKLRTERNSSTQFALDDPYGRDLPGEGYMETFLPGFRGEHVNAYRYVEAVDPTDGKRYRYTAGTKVVGKKDPTHAEKERLKDPNFSDLITQFAATKAPAPSEAPRYGVTYDDISTPEDRKIWVAGSSLRVIDLTTNEVLAERVGYMIDVTQGSRGTGGGRSPWLAAANNACPPFRTDSQPGFARQAGQTARFVKKVLRPKKASQHDRQ